MNRITVLVFGKSRHHFLRLPATLNEGNPRFRLPEANIQPGEQATTAAARYARETLGVLVEPADFSVIQMLAGFQVCLATVEPPFDERFALANSESRQGWMSVTELLTDAWTNPVNYAMTLAPLMFEVRTVLDARLSRK